MRPWSFRKRLGMAALGLSAWLFHGCNAGLSEGDATETGNARIAGQIVGEDGSPRAGAEVMVLTSGYNPLGAPVPDSQKDTTGADGRFRFTRLQAGRYNVQVVHRGSRMRSFIPGIDLGSDSVAIPKDTLHLPGGLLVPLPETRDSGVGYVYVPGSTFRARIDSELRIVGKVLLDSIPQGIIPSLVYTKGGPDFRSVLLATDVPVRKSEITKVDVFALWKHSARLLLNTSASGVPIAGDQTDFPLLVRLSAPVFDFSQAAADGADLRFAKADGTPLSAEIESWDAQAGKAEIWVRMDTVHAGSASQSIAMHWGKADAPASAGRRPVFDTSAGFAGVWHLGEEAEDTIAEGLYQDATGAGSHGDDRVASVSRAGVVGAGHGLDSGDYIESPRVSKGLMLKSSFTLSAWFRTDGKRLGPSGGELLNVGDNYGLRVYKDSVLHFWFWPPAVPAGSKTAWYAVDANGPAGIGFTDGAWHLAAGTFDGARLRLYVDGKEVANGAAPDVVGFLFPLKVDMGRHGNGKKGYEYAGDLDEAQIHGRVRDADWIRLSYENQKPGSGFPAFAAP